MCGRTENEVLVADGQERNIVSVARGHSARPSLEFGAGPFEAMVLVTERACGHGLEFDVVFAIRRGHDNRSRAGLFEQDALERGEAWGIEMLDHFDDGSGVIAGEAGVFIHQRALKKLDALALAGRKRIKAEAFAGALEDAGRDIDSQDFGERRIGQEQRKQAAFSAAKVEDAFCAGLTKSGKDRAHALLIEANALFQGDFFGGALFRDFVGILILFREARQGFAREAMLVLQITTGDFLTLGMRGKPASAATEKLFDFVLANPIVFVVVEDGKQDVEMLQDVLQALLCGESNAPIAAFAPFGKFFVERMPVRGDRVAEGFEEAVKKGFAAAARKNGDADLERELGIGEMLFCFTAAAQRRTKCSG